MFKEIRKILIVGGLIALLAITVLAGFWEKPELSMYDNWFKLRGERPSPSQVVVVAIDDRSIKELGALPWPREIHAALIDKLKDSSVIGFDMLFDTPGTSQGNQKLALAMQNHGKVVLASQFTFESDGKNTYQVPIFPIEELAMSTGGIGFINTSEDVDNVVRRLSIIDVNTFKRPFPCFSLAVYLAYMNLDPNSLSLSENNTLIAGNTAIPLDWQNQTLIDFWGPAATYSTYSYVDILRGKISREKLAGKILLVGPTSAAERDVKYTPFTRGNMVLSGALPVPGVEVHASALGTYLTSGYFNRASSAINLMILFGIGLLSGFAVYRAANPWQGLLYVLVLTASVSAAAFLSWNYQHYWINIASPIALTALMYTAATTENLVTTELERRRTRAAFARYVSPDVVSELLQNKSGISLGGARMDLTILFSDIRGFTTFSEHKEPEYIVQRLNEYFTEMTSVIFKYGGTLDKFLGDGIMAFYGAPIQCEDHADRAMKTATEMMERLAVLNQRWQDQGEPTIDIGIGINSGPVVVGNVGSSERMDYTIIGEDVNLAARLESMNKEHQTKILLSDRTRKYIVDPELKEKTEYLASANVRGMAEPVGIYTIKGFRNKTEGNDNK